MYRSAGFDTIPLPVLIYLHDKHEPKRPEIEYMERFAFYERAKKAYAVIATGETAIYANILLKKGVVLPEDMA